MKNLILYMLITVSSQMMAQNFYSELTVRNEMELVKKLRASRSVKKNKEIKELNNSFIEGLKIVLKEKETFSYPFDSLKNMMSTITSPDKSFRLFNWNVELDDGSQQFHCYILKKNGDFIELKDKHRYISSPQSKKLTEKNWYGAVYYEIIPLKGNKYTLLGWNGKSSLTTQKVIEVMSLGSKKAKFGASIFKFENKMDKRKRFILEYADDAYVSLKYYKQKKKEQIIYDHISPSTPQTEGFYQFYYPDLSYDNFTLVNGKWVHESLAEPKNKQSDNDKNYNDPRLDRPNLNR